ncbi:MAG TPA: serine/threonine-protein kinase [Polyangiaceae bacterium]|nr:serine/threonine-protein kinase [Polyangiaceae bacterium]
MTSSYPTSPYPQIGHYRVVRLLGRGGMGSVFLARDMRLGRSVALKLLANELSSATDRKQFDVEARTTARLSHPNVVTLFDIGEHEGRPWVALEYIDGCTLAQRMSEDWPTPAETLRIGLAIARAIEAAHGAGIVHRDLKPSNVLLGADGRPRVVDFGIARFLGGHSEPPADAEADDLALVGTPSYMAPEQWRGEDGPKTDVWALGLILYQLLTRAHPLRGLDAAQIAMRAELAEPVPSTPELHAASPELAPVVMQCLRRLPRERPAAAMLVTQLAALEGRLRAPTPSENPFRGLLPFSERHAHLFFGRDEEVSAFVERMRTQSILVVVGSSGAGKSSFVLAGVAPRLKESASVRVITVRPQVRPFAALAESIVRETPSNSGASTLVDPPRFAAEREPPTSADPRQLEARLMRSPGLLAVVLTEMAAQTGERVVLVVDQLEELCTVTHDEVEARAFLAAVCGAAGDPNEPVRVVMTVRDDFLAKLPWDANSGAALSGLVLLPPPDTDALREIVRQPLIQTGYDFDDPALLEEIVTSVRGEAACLPLLQFAMSLLWTRRDETHQLLLREVYDELGGVGGALAAHAENIVGALDPASLELCRQLLLRLVTASGTRRAIGPAALVMGLSAGAEGLVAKLLDARLLARQRGDDARVELAHESLTRVWRRLERWIEESHEDLAVAADLVAAAERWERLGKREDELWQGDALRDASRLVARGSTRLPEVALALVRESTRRERRGALRRTVAVASLFVAAAVAVLASSMAAWAWRERKNDALGAARRAEQASAVLLEERALASFAGGDNHAARAQLRAALEARDSVSSRNLARKLESAPLRVYLPHNTVV